MHAQGDPYGSLHCIFSHFTFLFLSPICVFIGVIAHSEPDDINEGLSIHFLIPENTVAPTKFLWSLFYSRMMQLHFICYFKSVNFGSTAKRVKQCKFWKGFPNTFCGPFLSNFKRCSEGFLLYHFFYLLYYFFYFSRENTNLKALVTGSYPESCVRCQETEWWQYTWQSQLAVHGEEWYIAIRRNVLAAIDTGRSMFF